MHEPLLILSTHDFQIEFGISIVRLNMSKYTLRKPFLKCIMYDQYHLQRRYGFYHRIYERQEKTEEKI